MCLNYTTEQSRANCRVAVRNEWQRSPAPRLLTFANEAEQPLQRAEIRRDAQVDLLDAEEGGFCAAADVTGSDHVDAGADAGALHRGYYGGAAPLEGCESVLHLRGMRQICTV